MSCDKLKKALKRLIIKGSDNFRTNTFKHAKVISGYNISSTLSRLSVTFRLLKQMYGH